ncbi:MAG: aminoglycoside phosphotransferase family protein [Ruminococcaceae bacterium]|nr:aminoglycoside phosphotransferase family protein [Oscillospiraceae bacterium]
MENLIQKVLRQFNIVADINEYGDGHINETYRIKDQPYLLQRVNTDIFKKPNEVMENIENVTEHLRKKIAAAGGDPNRETLTLVKTVDGKTYFELEDGRVYRVYRFIENAISYNKVESAKQFYDVARAFGKFQNMLADFPAEKLYETIPEFHNTPNRVNQLLEAIKNDAAGRLESVREEVDFALARAAEMDTVMKAMAEGLVPLRVTHNDTKLNNVMFDVDSKEPICVVDLDTVMPGSMLYDYGDALRFGASTADEDEKDLSKVWFDLELFKAFSQGYFEEMKSVITEKERELMPFGAKLMTYECGIRFLADYLNGDVYFKIHYPEQNLDRARTQLKLVFDMEAKWDAMHQIISELC